MALSIQQDLRYLGQERWRWFVWLEGAPEELDAIDHVMYVLDPTFHNPVREVANRETKFRLEDSTWGAFTLYAKAIHKDGLETRLQHDLVLLYPSGELATA
jgi:transcription initiation factor IIF auxiliary subunit